MAMSADVNPLDELAREEGFKDFESFVEAELPILWREEPWLESIARGINMSKAINVDQRGPIWIDIITQIYSKGLIDGRTFLTMSAASL